MIKLEVGKKFQTKGGVVYTVLKLDDSDQILPFKCDDGFWRNEQGEAFKVNESIEYNVRVFGLHNTAKEIE